MGTLFLIAIIGFISYSIGYRKGYVSGQDNIEAKRKYETLDINDTGEKIVIAKLKHKFKRPTNYLLNNITLPNDKNGTTQIDHILINEYGIFVIETKHYTGWIFGKEQDYKWTQSFTNGQKFQFFNPIKQNEAHINQLKNYLRHLPIESFISIVVFSGGAEIKTDVGKNVIYERDLENHIKNYQTKRLNLNDIHTIIGRLEFHRKEPSKETDEAHIKYVQSIKN